MDTVALSIIFGKVIMLSLFAYEMKNPNKLGKRAETHESLQTERIYFYVTSSINISLQCYYLFYDVISVYYMEDTDNTVWISVLFLIGFITCIAGSYLRTKAKQQLGEFFTYQLGVTEGQKLITNGVYSYVMHPSYIGFCIIILGISISHQSIVSFVTFIVLIAIAITMRIPKEEALLSKHFGTEFELYRKNRWRMVPFVY